MWQPAGLVLIADHGGRRGEGGCPGAHPYGHSSLLMTTYLILQQQQQRSLSSHLGGVAEIVLADAEGWGRLQECTHEHRKCVGSMKLQQKTNTLGVPGCAGQASAARHVERRMYKCMVCTGDMDLADGRAGVGAGGGWKGRGGGDGEMDGRPDRMCVTVCLSVCLLTTP